MTNAEARPIRTAKALSDSVDRAVAETPIIDMHTHLYAPAFGSLLLWGVDELVTYHYLIAEVLRTDRSVSPGEFWAMTTPQRADHIWRVLFVENEPISEARRGVLTTLKQLGIAPGPNGLAEAREYFRDVTVEQHVDTVLRLSNVSSAVMTNDPFDDAERAVWLSGPEMDPRFRAAMRIDPLLNAWDTAVPKLKAMGYGVSPVFTQATYDEVRRFLDDWADRMDPLYLAVSLPSDFAYPAGDARSRIIANCVLPFCRERGLPFALMVGVKRLVNPDLRLAGDSVGKWDMNVLDRLCAENPEVRFLVTVLARENQHELCVTARKFPNLLPFGCWWFLNNPSLILEMTRMRVELLGFSFVPQHSDARILDQLVYKWEHSRAAIATVLKEKYADLMATGWPLTDGDIRRDVEQLLGGNLRAFAG
ncbi:MAG: glucuronate isomerase [Armatimonadetes bacterium]|nr:glucuronate isomerase [Armatimonadota bacterium]